jgi:hypothetical protein
VGTSSAGKDLRFVHRGSYADAVLATIQKLGQQRASLVSALRAQIMAIHLQHIEGVQEHIGHAALPAKHTAHAVEKSETPSGPQITPSAPQCEPNLAHPGPLTIADLRAYCA